jgi:glutamine amidotransferase
MTTVIIDYGSGNLRSAAKAFERAASEAGSHEPIVVSSDVKVIARAVRIVLPGVGAFQDCMRGLRALDGLQDILQEAVIEKGRPFLGICVGMQLLATEGIEFGHHQGLGWIGGQVVPLAPRDATLKIPHMGWNELDLREAGHPVLQGLSKTGRHVYFVHSYHMQLENQEQALATTDYGGPVMAAVGRDNIVGTQFHPEKSQEVGLQLITNFLRWRP